MSSYRNDDFQKRLSHAAEAKQRALARFKAAPGPDDPVVAEHKAAREAIHASRLRRATEREAVRRAREAEMAEQAAREAERAAKVQQEEAELAALMAAQEAERDAALKAEQKAARDVRYAARKAAKKQRRKG